MMAAHNTIENTALTPQPKQGQPFKFKFFKYDRKTNVHLSFRTAISRSLWCITIRSLAAERLHLQIGRVCWHGEYPQRVGVAKTTLPALHSDDSSASFDDVEVERGTHTVANTVVDL